MTGANFNPRSHERSDLHERLFFRSVTISIHAPTRGATSPSMAVVPIFDFNPRSHERSDSVTLLGFWWLNIFQSTLPREERPGEAVNFVTSSTFQSTLPREERLIFIILAMTTGKISIHAPTRGATQAVFSVHCPMSLFQSTLPREERHFRKAPLAMVRLFQSTLPREERHGGVFVITLYSDFNPRSHERSDSVKG